MCSDQYKGGELVLLDSRTNANRGYKEEFKKLFENKTYLPTSGEYLMFPSHVYHHTIPFTGSMRLAMPVDLFL
jgi:predicted 2-oxoglutarate/Fe(II)-dependent dioxygenase YbiX